MGKSNKEVTYDFSWIDKKVEEFKGYNNPILTVEEFVETIIYPNGIFFWFMPGEEAIMKDEGGNNFVGDFEGYLIQLEKYVEKYRPSKWWKQIIRKRLENTYKLRHNEILKSQKIN